MWNLVWLAIFCEMPRWCHWSFENFSIFQGTKRMLFFNYHQCHILTGTTCHQGERGADHTRDVSCYVLTCDGLRRKGFCAAGGALVPRLWNAGTCWQCQNVLSNVRVHSLTFAQKKYDNKNKYKKPCSVHLTTFPTFRNWTPQFLNLVNVCPVWQFWFRVTGDGNSMTPGITRLSLEQFLNCSQQRGVDLEWSPWSDIFCLPNNSPPHITLNKKQQKNLSEPGYFLSQIPPNPRCRGSSQLASTFFPPRSRGKKSFLQRDKAGVDRKFFFAERLNFLKHGSKIGQECLRLLGGFPPHSGPDLGLTWPNPFPDPIPPPEPKP